MPGRRTGPARGMLCPVHSPSHVARLQTVVYPQTQVVRRFLIEVFSMAAGLAADLSRLLSDPARVFTAPQILDRLSHDFYWYSPVLRPQLASKVADIAVQPRDTQELIAVLQYAGRHEVPVTVRGAGTGNYGQCVPLEGGIL